MTQDHLDEQCEASLPRDAAALGGSPFFETFTEFDPRRAPETIAWPGWSRPHPAQRPCVRLWEQLGRLVEEQRWQRQAQGLGGRAVNHQPAPWQPLPAVCIRLRCGGPERAAGVGRCAPSGRLARRPPEPPALACGGG
jgi:hypothetical protein